MKNNIYGYAFDIEGTLYNKGKLQRGAIKLFNTIAQTNKPVAFVSGMNNNEITNVVNMITKKVHGTISYYIASNTGAYITNTKNEQVYAQCINLEMIKAIQNVVFQYPDTILLYRSNSFNFITTQPNDGQFKIANLDKITKSNRHYNIIDQSTAISLEQSNQVFSIEVTTYNQSKINEIYTKISNIFSNGYVLLLGEFIQITHSNKWTALRTIFDQNAPNICYFGDGINDIECLTNCRYSILTNSHLKQMYDLIEDLGSQNKFATNNLANGTLLKYITNQEYKFDILNKITQKTKQKMI